MPVGETLKHDTFKFTSNQFAIRTFADGCLPFGRTFWSPTIFHKQPYFAGFVGMENCIFSLYLVVTNFLEAFEKDLPT